MLSLLLSNSNCFISNCSGAWHYQIFPNFLKRPASKWRMVRVKLERKLIFLKKSLINIRSENLPKRSKERLQYLCNALKLNLFGEKKELDQSE